MAMFDLPMLGMLKTKMQWHQARQGVLAHNVANADTPRFRPSDLKAMDSKEAMRPSGLSSVSAARTNSAHIKASMGSQKTAFDNKTARGWETTPAGNSVVLEEQMIKVSANQFDFQMASTLYSRSLGLLKTAIGRG